MELRISYFDLKIKMWLDTINSTTQNTTGLGPQGLHVSPNNKSGSSKKEAG